MIDMTILRNIVLIVFIVLLLIGYVINLTCYSCADCNDPFDTNQNSTTITMDGNGLSCIKTKGARLVDRNITEGCSPFTAVADGVWCCETDLCNDANRILSIHSFAVVLIINLIAKFRF